MLPPGDCFGTPVTVASDETGRVQCPPNSVVTGVMYVSGKRRSVQAAQGAQFKCDKGCDIAIVCQGLTPLSSPTAANCFPFAGITFSSDAPFETEHSCSDETQGDWISSLLVGAHMRSNATVVNLCQRLDLNAVDVWGTYDGLGIAAVYDHYDLRVAPNPISKYALTPGHSGGSGSAGMNCDGMNTSMYLGPTHRTVMGILSSVSFYSPKHCGMYFINPGQDRVYQGPWDKVLKKGTWAAQAYSTGRDGTLKNSSEYIKYQVSIVSEGLPSAWQTVPAGAHANKLFDPCFSGIDPYPDLQRGDDEYLQCRYGVYVFLCLERWPFGTPAAEVAKNADCQTGLPMLYRPGGLFSLISNPAQSFKSVYNLMRAPESTGGAIALQRAAGASDPRELSGADSIYTPQRAAKVNLPNAPRVKVTNFAPVRRELMSGPEGSDLPTPGQFAVNLQISNLCGTASDDCKNALDLPQITAYALPVEASAPTLPVWEHFQGRRSASAKLVNEVHAFIQISAVTDTRITVSAMTLLISAHSRTNTAQQLNTDVTECLWQYSGATALVLTSPGSCRGSFKPDSCDYYSMSAANLPSSSDWTCYVSGSITPSRSAPVTLTELRLLPDTALFARSRSLRPSVLSVTLTQPSGAKSLESALTLQSMKYESLALADLRIFSFTTENKIYSYTCILSEDADDAKCSQALTVPSNGKEATVPVNFGFASSDNTKAASFAYNQDCEVGFPCPLGIISHDARTVQRAYESVQAYLSNSSAVDCLSSPAEGRFKGVQAYTLVSSEQTASFRQFQLEGALDVLDNGKDQIELFVFSTTLGMPRAILKIAGSPSQALLGPSYGFGAEGELRVGQCTKAGPTNAPAPNPTPGAGSSSDPPIDLTSCPVMSSGNQIAYNAALRGVNANVGGLGLVVTHTEPLRGPPPLNGRPARRFRLQIYNSDPSPDTPQEEHSMEHVTVSLVEASFENEEGVPVACAAISEGDVAHSSYPLSASGTRNELDLERPLVTLLGQPGGLQVYESTDDGGTSTTANGHITAVIHNLLKTRVATVTFWWTQDLNTGEVTWTVTQSRSPQILGGPSEVDGLPGDPVKLERGTIYRQNVPVGYNPPAPGVATGADAGWEALITLPVNEYFPALRDYPDAPDAFILILANLNLEDAQQTAVKLPAFVPGTVMQSGNQKNIVRFKWTRGTVLLPGGVYADLLAHLEYCGHFIVADTSASTQETVVMLYSLWEEKRGQRSRKPTHLIIHKLITVQTYPEGPRQPPVHTILPILSVVIEVNEDQWPSFHDLGNELAAEVIRHSVTVPGDPAPTVHPVAVTLYAALDRNTQGPGAALPQRSLFTIPILLVPEGPSSTVPGFVHILPGLDVQTAENIYFPEQANYPQQIALGDVLPGVTNALLNTPPPFIYRDAQGHDVPAIDEVSYITSFTTNDVTTETATYGSVLTVWGITVAAGDETVPPGGLPPRHQVMYTYQTPPVTNLAAFVAFGGLGWRPEDGPFLRIINAVNDNGQGLGEGYLDWRLNSPLQEQPTIFQVFQGPIQSAIEGIRPGSLSQELRFFLRVAAVRIVDDGGTLKVEYTLQLTYLQLPGTLHLGGWVTLQFMILVTQDLLIANGLCT